MFHLIQNYQPEEMRSQLLQFAISRQSKFVPTTTSTNAENYRASVVLYDLEEWQREFNDLIHATLPSVFEALRMQSFTPSQIEMQLTAHGNGGYYKWHNDNGSEEVRTRTLTYVYYFWRTPKRFDGGTLEIESNESVKQVTPDNNAIVFFPSGLTHQVTPVRCDNRFGDSRFSVNGWLRF